MWWVRAPPVNKKLIWLDTELLAWAINCNSQCCYLVLFQSDNISQVLKHNPLWPWKKEKILQVWKLTTDISKMSQSQAHTLECSIFRCNSTINSSTYAEMVCTVLIINLFKCNHNDHTSYTLGHLMIQQRNVLHQLSFSLLQVTHISVVT